MLEGKKVGVVIPAYNEELLIADTIAGIPDFVDYIVVVDDLSRDKTVEKVEALEDPRILLIKHDVNQGVGAAIVAGYHAALAARMDVTAVIAADNQMDPDDLLTLVEPVARGEVDYAKANRLFTGKAWEQIPHSRYLGNAVLSLF